MCNHLSLRRSISVKQSVRCLDHTLASLASFCDHRTCHLAHSRQLWEGGRRDGVKVKGSVQIYAACHLCTGAECTVQADGLNNAQVKGLNCFLADEKKKKKQATPLT